MTAEMAGRTAVNGTWDTLRRLKEQWVLVAFLAGAVFWVRDVYEEFVDLPEMVRMQTEGLAALEMTVVKLEAELVKRLDGDRSPVLGFPGTRHSIEDGVPGAWVILRWHPVRRLRTDCTPVSIDAFMVDETGRWYSVQTSMKPMPFLEGDVDLAFGLQIPSGMVHGRARAGVQVTSDCGSHLQVEMTPWQSFRVLGA
jgi:hypothetical protein